MRMLSPLSTEFSWPRRSGSADLAAEMLADFDRIVERFLRPAVANSVGFQPACDINETEDHYLVSFDMPGVKKEDIKIEVKANQLVISGERRRPMKDEHDDTTLRYERSYGKFERTFVLPTSVNTEKIEAHYENGVLNVALPKAESLKGRTVEVQSGQGGFFSKLLNSKRENTKELKDVRVS